MVVDFEKHFISKEWRSSHGGWKVLHYVCASGVFRLQNVYDSRHSVDGSMCSQYNLYCSAG